MLHQQETAVFERRLPFLLEQAMGIEPTTSAWEADVLPLNYACVRDFFILSQFQIDVKDD